MAVLASVASYRKAVVAWVGTAVILLASASAEFSSFLSPSVASWVGTVVAALTAVSVYLVKNADVIDNAGAV